MILCLARVTLFDSLFNISIPKTIGGDWLSIEDKLEIIEKKIDELYAYMRLVDENIGNGIRKLEKKIE